MYIYIYREREIYRYKYIHIYKIARLAIIAILVLLAIVAILAIIATANLRTEVRDFRGFDSGRGLLVRGGSPRPIGNFRKF